MNPATQDTLFQARNDLHEHRNNLPYDRDGRMIEGPDETIASHWYARLTALIEDLDQALAGTYR
jgi:hypothetical protein